MSAGLRVFVAAFAHETNRCSPIPTSLRSFEADLLCRAGPGAIDPRALEFPGYGYLVDTARENGDDVVLGLCAWTQPSAPMSRATYEHLRQELLDDLRHAGPVDLVFLVLHGAMTAEGYPDCEADLLACARSLVGDRVPVGALLDLHGNVSAPMAGSGSILVACKEYPHVDYRARTRELYGVLRAMALGRLSARTMVVPVHRRIGLHGTTEGPMQGFVRDLVAHEATAGLLSISAFHGFAWSDVDFAGASIVLVHEAHAAEVAVRVGAALAERFRRIADALPSGALTVDAALDAALQPAGPGPVVIADVSDNAGGGAASDSTFILRALIERGIEGAAVAMIWDPQAAALAADAGVGARLPLRFGGKVGPGSGDPIDAMAEVLSVRTDACQRGLDGTQRDPLGLAVAIRVRGIDVVLNTIRQQPFSPDCFDELGIDARSRRLLVVKSSQHFRAAFDRIASRTVYCSAPGSLAAV